MNFFEAIQSGKRFRNTRTNKWLDGNTIIEIIISDSSKIKSYASSLPEMEFEIEEEKIELTSKQIRDALWEELKSEAPLAFRVNNFIEKLGFKE